MRVCCITACHLIDNPRLFREADALNDAGHQVRVISVRMEPSKSVQEAKFMEGRSWEHRTINIEKTGGSWSNWFVTGVRKKLAKKIWNLGLRGDGLAGMAYTRVYSEIIKEILSKPADLIIAHTQLALAPAFFAAKRSGCRWGFDCEDVLSEEYGEGIQDLNHKSLVQYVEKRFIPKADYVTVASKCYSDWLRENLNRTDAVLIQNVPSISGLSKLPTGFPAGRNYISLYWFSQTIGPLRGIEDVLRAIAHIKVPVKLHLRGQILPDFEEDLLKLIKELRIENKVFFHDRILPGELPKAAQVHDVGLALMQPCCLNHELAVPNKIFAYMMAGLAVIATETKGHRSVFENAEGIGFLYEPGNFLELAEKIERFAVDPEKLLNCRKRSLELAEQVFNWEIEQKKLIDLVQRVGAG